MTPGTGKIFFPAKKYFLRRKTFFSIFFTKNFFLWTKYFFRGKKFFSREKFFFAEKFFQAPGTQPGPPGPARAVFEPPSGLERLLKTGPELVRSGFPLYKLWAGRSNVGQGRRPDLELKKRKLPAGSLGRSPGFFDFRP